MKKLFGFLRSVSFVLAVVLGFYALDFAVASTRVVELSSLFRKNDYEKIIVAHGGAVAYDKVLYGNSVLISAYMEGEGDYVNFGMDYATLVDLRDMLRRGELAPREDLVLLLNYFVLLDSMDTNPSYPWHRAAYVPYLYFRRDSLLPVLKQTAKSLLATRTLGLDALPRYTDTGRTVYYGIMTDAELDERIAVHAERYWGLGLDAYRKNLDALREIIDHCAARGVTLRVVLAPWNDYIDMPENPQRAMDAAVEICDGAGVEVLDLTHSFPRKCFHDLGHFNYEYGAARFTKELNLWLNS